MNISNPLNISTINKKDDIRFFLDNGRKVYNKFGIIFLYDLKDRQDYQCAILLKKSCGSAVKRNYIKRIIRHFIRDHIEIFKSYNRIIFLYRSNKDISYHFLQQEYLDTLKRQ